MAALLDDTTKNELNIIFSQIKGSISLLFFTDTSSCETCEQQQEVLEELAALSSKKVVLRVYHKDKNKNEFEQYAIDKVPATAVLGEKDFGVRFYGITGGYEFSSLIETILMVSVGKVESEFQRYIDLIDTPMHLEVMTTLTCPYCAKMVHTANQLAILSDFIQSDMVESSEFPELVQKYQVSGVPRVAINGEIGFDGALPFVNVILELLKIAKPDEYERIEREINELIDKRSAIPVSQEKLYDIVIVGAGPAAMSAAIYSARKNLTTAVIGEHVGGQITSTSVIENWPGLEAIGGNELAQMMRNHAHHYDVAENFNAKIAKITKEENIFYLHTPEGEKYMAKSVIYCAGKENRKLHVKGEEKFIGNGVAFCATCDAPLYKGKNVAVVGGGNSAFTALRDLIGFAKHIYLIHTSDNFKADKELIDQALAAENVTIMTFKELVEFVGVNKLEKIVLSDTKTSLVDGLSVDGVFLEIGLVPNSKPVQELVKLNERGEVIVDRAQRTSLAGLFAAGDVTDEVDKQIVIAAGAGAKAALEANRYLQS